MSKPFVYSSPAKILTLAGTDPSSGAGIQADLKTFSALGCYATTVITALVAQNTCGVQRIFPLELEIIVEQLQAITVDIPLQAVKLGMLHRTEIIQYIAQYLAISPIILRVFDPVMVAKSGDRLLDPTAIDAIRYQLCPQVSLLTPNLPEAAVLLDSRLATTECEMIEQGHKLLAFGCQAVLIKGGHLGGDESPDWLVTAKGQQRFTSPRIPTKNTHGTGCSYSAALTAFRLHSPDWASAVNQAKVWLQGAIANADQLDVGRGRGPLHHFWQYW